MKLTKNIITKFHNIMDRMNFKIGDTLDDYINTKEELDCLDDNKELSILNNNNIILVSSSNQFIKNMLIHYNKNSYNKNELQKNPNLDYDEDEASSFFTSKHIVNACELCDIFKEGLKLNVKSDYPITIENSLIKIIIAPRSDE